MSEDFKTEQLFEGITWAYRFRTNITLVNLTALALSIQFSPSYGRKYLWLLFTSWGVLLFATCLGTYLLHKYIHFKIDIGSVSNEEEKAKEQVGKIVDRFNNHEHYEDFQIWLIGLAFVMNIVFIAINIFFVAPKS